MTIKKITEIREKMLQIVVTDSISKKQYFKDSEISGWVLMWGEEEVMIYHLYRRGWDPEEKEEVEEPLIYIDEKLGGKEKQRALKVIKEEAELQKITGENTELMTQIENFLM